MWVECVLCDLPSVTGNPKRTGLLLRASEGRLGRVEAQNERQ